MNHIISDNPKHMKYLKKFEAKWDRTKSVVSEYEGANRPIKIFCYECGSTYEKKYASEAIRHGCPECYRETRKLNLAGSINVQQTTEEFVRKLKNKFSDRYTLTGPYEGMKTVTTFRCNKCSKVRRMKPDDLMHRRDRKCTCDAPETIIRAEKRRQRKIDFELAKQMSRGKNNIAQQEKLDLKIKEFSKMFTRLWEGEYQLLSPYDPLNEKISLKHIPCGEVEHKYVSSLFKGHGCRKCSNRGESKAVVEISKIMDDMNLTYETEVRFPDCKRKRALPFDFGVYEDGKLKFLLEYDGEQHYRPMYRRDGQRRLELVQERDRIKTAYCQSNSIPLLRIKFTEFERVSDPIANLKRIIFNFIEGLPGRL